MKDHLSQLSPLLPYLGFYIRKCQTGSSSQSTYNAGVCVCVLSRFSHVRLF